MLCKQTCALSLLKRKHHARVRRPPRSSLMVRRSGREWLEKHLRDSPPTNLKGQSFDASGISMSLLDNEEEPREGSGEEAIPVDEAF